MWIGADFSCHVSKDSRGDKEIIEMDGIEKTNFERSHDYKFCSMAVVDNIFRKRTVAQDCQTAETENQK